jgi:hypothetical protein
MSSLKATETLLDVVSEHAQRTIGRFLRMATDAAVCGRHIVLTTSCFRYHTFYIVPTHSHFWQTHPLYPSNDGLISIPHLLQHSNSQSPGGCCANGVDLCMRSPIRLYLWLQSWPREFRSILAEVVNTDSSLSYVSATPCL